MSLSNHIRELRKQKIIDDFKNKYPEVYEWFNSDYFIDFMTNNKVIFIPWEHDLTLPRYDSNGGVNIHEVCLYLSMEGFNKIIHYDNGLSTLEISL